MAFTDSLSVTHKTPSGAVSVSSIDAPGSTRQNPPVTVPAATSNYHVALSSVDVGELVSFLMYSSQDVTIATNSSTTPSQSFSLAAGVGLAWNMFNGQTNPLTVNITDLYITNPGATPATILLSFLEP
jgi:hypothetical protein